MTSIFSKTLYDKRGFILGWSVGLIALSLLMLSFYPAFSQGDSFSAFTKNIPPQFRSLIGNLESFKEINNFIAAQLFDIRVPIFVSVLGIILGTSLSVGEEDTGVLRTLTSLPLSRGRILFQKWLGLVVICLIACSALILGTVAGATFIGQISNLNFWTLSEISLMTFLLTMALGTITMSIGLATGKRGLTTGISTMIAILSFILTTFSANVDWLKPYENFSLMHYFAPKDIPVNGLNPEYVLILISITIVSLSIAAFCFRRRDITE